MNSGIILSILCLIALIILIKISDKSYENFAPISAISQLKYPKHIVDLTEQDINITLDSEDGVTPFQGHQNPIGAEVCGIDVKKIYILTYGLGIALAGIAGCLLTQFYSIFPTAGASFGFRALIVVVVGGLGSIPGAFFAGILLGLLEQMSALFISPSYSDMIVFMTFIIILVVRQLLIMRRK